VEELLALRPARARIDLDRLAANCASVAAYAQVPLLPVVKADAYGHGAVPVAIRLVRAGAERLAVALPEEGAELRAAGLEVPIVVLAGFTAGQVPLLARHRLTPVVSTGPQADALLAAPVRPPSAHVKVDTGMARLGFTRDAFVDAALRLADAGVEVEGAMTHFACADESEETTARQLDLFEEAVGAMAARGLRPGLVHASNSAGLSARRAGLTLARPGLLLYGLPTRPLSPPVDVRPVMTVSADIALVKDVPAGTPVSYGGRWTAARPSRIATVPLGYADGVPRTDPMRDRGAFLVRGRRAPVAGTICMDLTMLDVTDDGDVREGDEAVLFGDRPTAWDVADLAGTNAWQVLTAIGPRVPRVYVEAGRVVRVATRYGNRATEHTEGTEI
jgi:alanine racemase